METDLKKHPVSLLDGSFITQQRSEQPTRPVFPQVSSIHLSAANTNYENLHNYFLTYFLQCPVLPHLHKQRPSRKW